MMATPLFGVCRLGHPFPWSIIEAEASKFDAYPDFEYFTSTSRFNSRCPHI